jgi:predicted DNA binding CopG/RHH family protein
MERVKNMTKKLMEERQKAEDRISELEQEIEDMKLKLEEVGSFLKMCYCYLLVLL